MKKNLTMMLFLFCTLTAFAQSNSNKDYLLQKSRNQKTAFFVIAGTGTAAAITGLIYATGHNDPNKFKYSYTGGFIALGGLTLVAASIPFLVSSNKNRRRAMSLSVKNDPLLLLQKNSFVYQAVPSLSLKLRL